MKLLDGERRTMSRRNSLCDKGVGSCYTCPFDRRAGGIKINFFSLQAFVGEHIPSFFCICLLPFIILDAGDTIDWWRTVGPSLGEIPRFLFYFLILKRTNLLYAFNIFYAFIFLLPPVYTLPSLLIRLPILFRGRPLDPRFTIPFPSLGLFLQLLFSAQLALQLLFGLAGFGYSACAGADSGNAGMQLLEPLLRKSTSPRHV
jgi:hypothetical protein